MATIGIYRNYSFIDKDPICYALKTIIRSDEHLKNHQVHQISGVATATLDNWFDGTTRRPQNATVTQVTASLGYVRRDTLNKDGTVSVRFVKVHAIDQKKEIRKQADWILKHAKPTKRRKKKATNGHDH